MNEFVNAFRNHNYAVGPKPRMYNKEPRRRIPGRQNYVADFDGYATYIYLP
jgi:hypothetical protein